MRALLVMGAIGTEVFDLLAPSLGASDAFRLLSSYLQPSHQRDVVFWLRPGDSEIAVAAVVDALPRSLALRVTSASEAEGVVRTRNGLRLVASTTWSASSVSGGVIAVGPTAPALSPDGRPVGQLAAANSGSALDEVLAYLEEHLSAGHRRTVATMLEYPVPD